jgi:hypothetical protein
MALSGVNLAASHAAGGTGGRIVTAFQPRSARLPVRPSTDFGFKYQCITPVKLFAPSARGKCDRAASRSNGAAGWLHKQHSIAADVSTLARQLTVAR